MESLLASEIEISFNLHDGQALLYIRDMLYFTSGTGFTLHQKQTLLYIRDRLYFTSETGFILHER
jgi:hypothetical protein